MTRPIRFGALWVHLFPPDTPPCEMCGRAIRTHAWVWLDESGTVVSCNHSAKESGRGRPR